MRALFILLFALGLLLQPTRLAELRQRPWPVELPSAYNLGSPVILNGHPDWREVRLNGRRMTYLDTKNVWLGAAPRGQVGLTVWWRFDRDALEFSEAVIPTQSPLLKQASNLRLPAETWKRMSDPNLEQRQRDRQTLSLLLNDYSGSLDQSCWQIPLKTKITSKFGSPRRLPNGRSYHHSGEDRRAPIGTKILATGPGQVAFAGDMLVPGTNVVIRHGDGWFSRYMHFSKALVQSGESVKTGQLIGHSGASGRVEAPHLHWEILWKGIPLDPDHFLQAWGRLCDPA